MKLETTKEKVLEAAEKCSTAKETLKILFPEAFEIDEGINKTMNLLCGSGLIIQRRKFGDFKDKAFWLHNNYDWRIVVESTGGDGDQLILIPTKL